MIGQTVSHYRILSKLGEGGMGVVYEAEDTKLKRTVALKFLPPELTRDPQAKARFVHEAQAASALDHPNVCTIHEIGETDDGQLFIAMACHEGVTVKAKIAQRPLLLEEAIDIAQQVALGLSKAHQRGITHRDIKPANIFITEDGLVKILDFGLAKLSGQTRMTRDGTTLGTVAYLSPEQAKGEEVDARADIWSLGITLYEMVTGRLPFEGEHAQAVLRSILSDEPESVTALRARVPMELDRILGKCLAKQPGQRYQHVDELLIDLRNLEQRSEVTTPGDQTGNTTGTLGKRVVLMGGLAAVAAILIIGGLQILDGDDERISSIAVLPLENLSGDPEQEYFADGMTDELIARLARIHALRVISRTSVKQYKQTTKSVPVIARELGVDVIVEGTVFREGNTVRITAQLIHGLTDRHLWADRYERDLSDVLTLQNEVAQAIAREIEVQLTPQEADRLTSARSVAPEVQDAYLKGKFHLDKLSVEGSWKALEYFQEAIARDSTFAPAHARLALTWVTMGEALWQVPPMEAMPKARSVALKAMELDETEAEAHTALGYVLYFYDWNWPEAEREVRQALELNPNSVESHIALGMGLICQGRRDEGLSHGLLAVELDPLSLGTRTCLGELYFWAREYDRAIKIYLDVLELDPDFSRALGMLHWVYYIEERYEDAIALWREHAVRMGTDPEDMAWVLDYEKAYREQGPRGYWLHKLERYKERARREYVNPGWFAEIYANLGDKDNAFAWLEKCYEERTGTITVLKVKPDFDSLRSDPRFEELLERVGLSQ